MLVKLRLQDPWEFRIDSGKILLYNRIGKNRIYPGFIL